MSASWKHHFYAFLLRRALGPLLTTQSAAHLRSSIQDVDWSEGKIVLVDVELDSEYLTRLIGKSGNEECNEEQSSTMKNVAVQKAKIRRFGIHLSLLSENSSCAGGDDNQSAPSTARKATSALLRNIFGSFDDSSSGIALVVHVELDGVEIEFVPSMRNKSDRKQSQSHTEEFKDANTTPSSIPDQDVAAPGFFSSLVDSAMKSLRLSIDIKDVTFCMKFSQHNDHAGNRIEPSRMSIDHTTHSIKLQLASARYYDLMETKNDNTAVLATEETEKLVLSKAVDWNGLAVEVGQHALLQTSGKGHVKFRFYETWEHENNTDSDSQTLSGRREVEVALGHHISLDVNSSVLTQLIAASNALSSTNLSEQHDDLVFQETDHEDLTDFSTPRFTLADEFTREAYDEVMKQYTEARHLARTREIRGGILIPSFDNDENGTADISFDAFFDANDHSVSYYCDLMDDGLLGGSRSEQIRKQHVQCMTTKVDFGMSEFTLKLSSEESNDTTTSEFVLVSVGDLQFILFASNGESKINCSISHLEIESQVLEGQSALNETILRFVDHSEGESGVGLVSSPPCISAYMELSKIDEGNGCRIDLVLQPIEIVYRHRAILCLTQLLSTTDTMQQKPEEAESGDKKALHLSVSCGSLVLLMPCSRLFEADPLFTRCGYQDNEERLNPFLGMGIEFDNISTELSNEGKGGFKTVTKFSSAIFFVKNTKLGQRKGRRRFISSHVSQRTDLIAFTSDQDRASDSSIVLSYTRFPPNRGQQQGMRKTFPIILPLSSMKARQEIDDSDDECDFFDEVMQSPGSRTDPSNFKTTDSQYIMSSEASEAENEISINIPCVFFDITLDERRELISILSDINSQTTHAKTNKDEIFHSKTTPHCEEERKRTCFAVSVGQLSFVFYGSEEITSSYSFVLDKTSVHTLIDNVSGVRNVRISTSDLTLYELSNGDNLNRFCNDKMSPVSGADKCKRVQERLIPKKHFSQSRAIFFRSKLSEPLSKEFPAILVDILLRKSHEESLPTSLGDQYNENTVHISVYDMTYRYFVGSQWFSNLSNLIKGQTEEKESESHEVKEDEKEITSSLTNLFINVTDCNFDHTTPTIYKTASRSFLRIGEVQISSNLIMPPEKVQAFKVSLSEIGLYVCDNRYPYNEENTYLSCAHRHYNQEDLSLPGNKRRIVASLDSTLGLMDFIKVIQIDSIDTAILLRSGSERYNSEPEKSVVLTLGTIHCNFCKDSFSCLLETFNEWLLRFTALSDDELERLRLLSESKSQVRPESLTHRSMANGSRDNDGRPLSNTAPLTQTKHEDASSVDLSKTLLFQNYYTIDAKNNPYRVKGQQIMQSVRTVVESPSSDEEWAPVEHDYIKNSSIPRDYDQRAEWIMCDSMCTGNGQSVSAESHTIKVYPQHFPSKPLLDHVIGGQAKTPHTPGGLVAPQVGMRLIVKDASILCHFFDGLDWAAKLPLKKNESETNDRKKMLLNDLLDSAGQPSSGTLMPLPDERRRGFDRKRLRRNVDRYFSISISGLKLNQDSFMDSSDYQLASCMDLSISDFFVAETISSNDPVKMLGEWINEAEHPRDHNDGVIMLKMTTNHPALRVSSDGKLMSDESQATLELLPLRCFFHQTAIRFVRSFFSSEQGDGDTRDTHDNEDEIIPIFFTSFKVTPAKLKVDYTPEKMDVDSFREGNYVELLNLCPLEDMVLILQAVENHNLTGWGSVFGELASRWIEDVGTTQPHKFFTRATPVQFFSGIGEGVADLAMVIVVPESGNFADYLKDVLYSSTSFASKLACETLTTSAKLTKYAANQLNSKNDLLPRPKTVPKNLRSTAGHGYESISRGLRKANYKIVTVPLREYQQNGASGAARSAVKGLPIAVLAPLSGASEALSYTLLGLRNSLRPDLRKEAEASLQGLNFK